MEFGVVGASFSAYTWPDFIEAAVQLGAEAVELDTRLDAHRNTWAPDLDPAPIVQDLKSKGLRVGAVCAFVDFVQEDEEVLRREVETARAMTDLSFCYRSEVVRLSPQRPKSDMSRQGMLDSIAHGCEELLAHAEQTGILICLTPDPALLCDADTIRQLIDRSASYNLKVTLDVFTWLQVHKDPEAVRTTVTALLDHTAHVILRDGTLDGSTGTVIETPVGRGSCPVDMVVAELSSGSFYRPFYVAYEGIGDAFGAVREGIRYFRELPNRILREMGLL